MSKNVDELKLFDQDTFYLHFKNDLISAKQRVVIESPFITLSRVRKLMPHLKALRLRQIPITINTKPPEELNGLMADQANSAVAEFQTMGITVLYTAGHHRKLAVIDDLIVWQGSLNILSQYDSSELMMRIRSKNLATEVVEFARINSFLD